MPKQVRDAVQTVLLCGPVVAVSPQALEVVQQECPQWQRHHIWLPRRSEENCQAMGSFGFRGLGV